MKSQIIKKNKRNLLEDPNLSNYTKEYKNFGWDDAKTQISFMRGGLLNAAYNAVERHAEGWRRHKLALIWLDEDRTEKRYTFAELNNHANKFANMLVDMDVTLGDRVFFFLPRVPELYFGFLGTLKTGAIAGMMFSAFGEQALEDRLDNSSAKVVVTNVELLPRLLNIIEHLPHLKNIVVLSHGKAWRRPKVRGKKFFDYDEIFEDQSVFFRTRFLKPSTPAFMLYTSGTTGKPKGVVHAHHAIVQQHYTAKMVLDISDEDMYWCTADPGWVTGISYGILGIWSAGATSFVYNGKFDPASWYSLIEKYQVNIWYTAPTAIRMLQAAGDDLTTKYDFSSLRHICSVGEPLNPEPIRWAYKVFGLPFHDTWFQTETGAIMIANYASMDIKVGSMGKPVPGIKASIVDDKGKALPPYQEGHLVVKPKWPSMMVKIWRRPNKYKSYFEHGWYYTGDKAYMDKSGYFWFIGRADDIIKTSGERVGPFEVESALVEHPDIVEAGVIGKPDALRGEIIKAFVKLRSGVKGNVKLVEDIQKFVKKNLAGHAYPREIEFVDSLPKTRSGKIMRRVLKARELGLPEGDLSTLEEY
jgi:acetyl-CoA synthetase